MALNNSSEKKRQRSLVKKSPDLKILLVTQEFSVNKGGSAVYAYELAQSMARGGVEVHVMVFGAKTKVEQIAPNLIVHWHKVINLPLLRVPSHHIQVFLKSKRIIQENGLTTVHSNNNAAAFVRTKHPMIATIHHSAGDEVLQHKSFIQRLIYTADYYFEKRILNNSSVLIVVSHLVKKSIHRTAPKKSIKVIPDGVDLEVFKNKPASSIRKKLGINKNEILLFFPGGTRSKRKGALDLFSALQGANFSQYKCLVSGEPRTDIGWGQELELAFKRSGLADHFIFLGEINYNELPIYYSAADIVVYPSTFEGFGLPALEALACGKPLICTKTGEMPYFIKDDHNGLLINVGDTAQLQSALEKLAGSRVERKRLSRNARRSILSYSWNSMSERIIKLHNQALERVI